MKNHKLKRQILEISHKHKLSHIGSCLTTIDIIDDVYSIKKEDEIFILSSGHAGLALYVVLEDRGGKSAEEIFAHHGVHPDRCDECGISCSSGSLGQGLPIAVGIALADRSKNVYCLISDGEYAEGSIWEAIRIASENNLQNLKIYVNFNGWAAYRQTTPQIDSFIKYCLQIYPSIKIIQTDVKEFVFLKDQDAHYHVMNDDEYMKGMELFK